MEPDDFDDADVVEHQLHVFDARDHDDSTFDMDWLWDQMLSAHD